jgi:hypothetical protein
MHGLAFGLIAVTAALSYRSFETRFLKIKMRHTVIRSQPVGALTDRSA